MVSEIDKTASKLSVLTMMAMYVVSYLQPGVNSETTSSGVHTGDILGVVDVLESQLIPVIPMLMVNVLSNQCMWLHCEVFVHLKVKQ